MMRSHCSQRATREDFVEAASFGRSRRMQMLRAKAALAAATTLELPERRERPPAHPARCSRTTRSPAARPAHPTETALGLDRRGSCRVDPCTRAYRAQRDRPRGGCGVPLRRAARRVLSRLDLRDARRGAALHDAVRTPRDDGTRVRRLPRAQRAVGDGRADEGRPARPHRDRAANDGGTRPRRVARGPRQARVRRRFAPARRSSTASWPTRWATCASAIAGSPRCAPNADSIRSRPTASLATSYEAPRPRGPFNRDARRAAGFSDAEIAALDAKA